MAGQDQVLDHMLMFCLITDIRTVMILRGWISMDLGGPVPAECPWALRSHNVDVLLNS